MRRTSVVFGLAAGIVLLAGLPASGQLTPIRVKSAVSQLNLGPQVDLQCSMGAAQVTVTNQLDGTVPTGTRLTVSYKYWETVHQGWTTQQVLRDFTGEHKLPSPLGHLAHLDFNVSNPAIGWQCSAWFHGGLPDLQTLQFTRAQSSGTVLIRNNNPFVDAGPFVLRIEAMKCSQVQLARSDFNLPGLPKGAVLPVTRPLPLPPGVQYFDVYLDATNTVKESNENNNLYTEVGVCIR